MAHPGGRPRKFQDLEEFQNLIDNYFNKISTTVALTDTIVDAVDEKGRPIQTHKIPRLNKMGEPIFINEYVEIPTVLGLCEHLGMTRGMLIDYGNMEEFRHTVKSAKEKIEKYLEEELHRKEQVTGIIFNLKNNFGWVDKAEITNTVINKDIAELTEEQLQEEINKLKS